jgi:hypothetical protein
MAESSRVAAVLAGKRLAADAPRAGRAAA